VDEVTALLDKLADEACYVLQYHKDGSPFGFLPASTGIHSTQPVKSANRKMVPARARLPVPPILDSDSAFACVRPSEGGHVRQSGINVDLDETHFNAVLDASNAIFFTRLPQGQHSLFYSLQSMSCFTLHTL